MIKNEAARLLTVNCLLITVGICLDFYSGFLISAAYDGSDRRQIYRPASTGSYGIFRFTIYKVGLDIQRARYNDKMVFLLNISCYLP